MPICKECGEEFAQKRANLGYRTCLFCGETTAKRQIKEKQSRILPAFNKGGYTMLSPDRTTAMAEAKGMARKTENQ